MAYARLGRVGFGCEAAGETGWIDEAGTGRRPVGGLREEFPERITGLFTPVDRPHHGGHPVMAHQAH